MHRLLCPCGEGIQMLGEAAFLELVREHLNEYHPELTYTDEQILSFAL